MKPGGMNRPGAVMKRLSRNATGTGPNQRGGTSLDWLQEKRER
jgi:hypothetical protein